MVSRVFGAVTLLAAALIPVPAQAQNGLAGILPALIRDITLAHPASGPDHSAHFNLNNETAPNLFNREIISQLATFPTGSSSGGFTFTFDPTLNAWSRNSQSFGPSFAERALTVGQGKLTVGANFQYSQYNWFNGINVGNGDINFFLRHANCCNNAFFQGDLVQVSLKLKLATNTTVLFANYGLMKNLDVSVTVPIVHASMDATTDATILRLATSSVPPCIHQFDQNCGTTATFHGFGSKTGLGDVLVRAKYRFLARPGGGLAVEVDGRLPTGDPDNLLGTGAGQVAFVLIGSTSRGKVATHFNVGYTLAADSDTVQFPNEFDYRGGAEYAISPLLTVSGDFIGRTLQNSDQLVLGQTTVSFTNFLGVAGTSNITEFLERTGALNVELAAVGGKFNVAKRFLISANILFPINWTGFRARVTPVFGFDYSF